MYANFNVVGVRNPMGYNASTADAFWNEAREMIAKYYLPIHLGRHEMTTNKVNLMASLET